MKKILYTIILSFLFSSSVFAEWKHFNDDLFIDYSSIKKNDGMFYIWSLINVKETESIYEDGYLSITVLKEYDCNNIPPRNREIATNAFSEKFAKGELKLSHSNKSSWDYASPGSVDDVLTEAFCEHESRN